VAILEMFCQDKEKGSGSFASLRKTTERQRQKGKEWIPAFAGMTRAGIGRAGAMLQPIYDCMQGFQGTGYCKYTNEKSTYNKNGVKRK
jgi:hypothetical protein